MNSDLNYELIIIGGGPAAVSAGIYAARKQIKTAIIADNFGGQSLESNEIQNWIGEISISGIDLAKKNLAHLKFYSGNFVDIKEGEKVVSIEKENNEYKINTQKNNYKTKTILVATGGIRKKLEIPGAKEFDGKGISYCASCDGLFFQDKDVVVIGGGNAGFETAAQLLKYCKSVTIISRGKFKADPIIVEKVLSDQKVRAIESGTPLEIKGDDFVKSITYRKTDPFVNDFEIKTGGIFVEIGHMPATEFLNGLVDLDEYGQIKIDHKTQRTSNPDIWAAGDCTDILYRQNNIAAGDAVKALEDIYQELHRRK